MAAIAGRLAKIECSFDGGGSWLNLGRVVDATLNVSVDELDASSHDSAVREYVPGMRDETLDASLRWDEANPAQLQILNSLYPTPTSFKIRFYMEVAATRKRFDADAFVTSASPSGPLDDIASFDVTMRLSGTVLATQ